MTNGQESAFAKTAFYHPEGGIDSPQSGLTIREYFASMAMQGILSNPNNHSFTQKARAIEAVEMADALIKELNKERVTFNTEKI